MKDGTTGQTVERNKDSKSSFALINDLDALILKLETKQDV